MQGVSLVETEVLQGLISRVEELQSTVVNALAELKDAKKPYLTVQELMELTGYGLDWVTDHKAEIGFISIGRNLRFKRKDVEEFMESGYYKAKNNRRGKG